MSLHHLFNVELTDDDERILEEVAQEIAAADAAKRKRTRAKRQAAPQSDATGRPSETHESE